MQFCSLESISMLKKDIMKRIIKHIVVRRLNIDFLKRISHKNEQSKDHKSIYGETHPEKEAENDTLSSQEAKLSSR